MSDDLLSGNAARKAATPAEGLLPNPKGKLREQFHEMARFKHFSLRPRSYTHVMRKPGIGVRSPLDG